jgi:hypothetical protein
MATIVEQLYSQTHWAGMDGVQTVWNFSFTGGYIFPEHVKAYYIDAAGTLVNIIVTNNMLIGPFQLRIHPAVPASAQRLVIYRSTPKDLPLVDFETGARVTEQNLDRIARQAVFIAAELLDGISVANTEADLSLFGYKALHRNINEGASAVATGDNGKAHVKLDGTDITVPDTLPTGFLTTLANLDAGSIDVTFTGAVQIARDGEGAVMPGLTVALPPYSTVTIWRASEGLWMLNGNVS